MVYVLIQVVHLGFEQANQPTLSDIQRKNLLNFCIVGMFKVAWCKR